MKKMRLFLRSNSGATAIEYAIIASVIGVGLISVATTLSTNISEAFQAVGQAIQPASNP